MQQEPQPETGLPVMIGPYKVVRKIAQGGMGEIFLVYDAAIGRNLALKRMRQDKGESDRRHQQFLLEARKTSQLTHPAIIPIYTIIDEPDLVYYTMPFIEAETLQQILDTALQQEQSRHPTDAKSSVKALSSIFLQVCQAIAYAHSKGIIHRDLKPSNIMVGAHGEIRLFDWGLVADLTEERRSSSKSLAGTLIYMAPELALGKPPSCQTEIYSLGLILYQMLTLRYPFHRGNPETYCQNLESEALIDPAKVAPHRNVPSYLSRIALKCLAPATEERYKSVDEIIEDFEKHHTQAGTPLSIAHALLAGKNFAAALSVYHMIAGASPATLEQCESLYYAGITLLEEGQSRQEPQKYVETEKEFHKLHGTAGGPLEYLGLALVCQNRQELESETLHMQAALSRFPHHPLLPIVHRQLFSRVQELSKGARSQFYPLALLVVRYLSPDELPNDIQSIIEELLFRLTPGYFVDQTDFQAWPKPIQYLTLAAHLAFLLADPQQLAEIFDAIEKQEATPLPIVGQILVALIKLQAWNLAQQKLDLIHQQFLDVQAAAFLDWLQEALKVCQGCDVKVTFLPELPKKITAQHLLPITLILDEALYRKETAMIVQTVEYLIVNHNLTDERLQQLDYYLIWSFMLNKNWQGAEEIFNFYLQKGTLIEPLKFLYGCFLLATKREPFSLPEIGTDIFVSEKQNLSCRQKLLHFCQNVNT